MSLDVNDWQAELRRTGIRLLRNPQDPEALFARGVAAHNLGQWDLAIDCLTHVRQVAGDQPVILRNLIRSLLMARRTDQALDRANDLVAQAPDDPENLALLGMALLSARRVEEALSVLQRCEALASPDAPCFVPNRYNQAIALLTLGRWREGWAFYEARWRFADATSQHLREALSVLPRWQPALHAGADLLVGAEQGSGDMIMVARYLPDLARMARSVTVIVPDRLRALLSASFAAIGNLHFQTPTEMQVGNHSHHLMSMSIPGALAVDADGMRGAPYLSVGAGTGGARRKPARMAVGFSWLGSPLHPDNELRSLPSDLAASFMARFPEVDFHAVAPASQVPATGMPPNLHRSLADSDGFERSAALIAEMDLVIAVDSAAAHLAGAIGMPVWTLLHWRCDWRWGLGEGEMTGWYDAMRLIRQERPGDWSGPLEKAAARLRALLEARA